MKDQEEGLLKCLTNWSTNKFVFLIFFNLF